MVAAVLLYGRETWCVMEAARRPLDGFHIETVRRITGKIPYKCKREGKEGWVYPNTADVLEAVGSHPLRHYIGKHRANIAKTIWNRAILLGCMGAERLEGSPRDLC